MRKKKRIIAIISIISIIFIAMGNVVYGIGLNDIKPQQPANNPLERPAKGILGFIQAIGVILSVIILIGIGIKYMTGSVEEKAEYKKTLVPYIIGAGFLFSASVFAQVIYEFVKSF